MLRDLHTVAVAVTAAPVAAPPTRPSSGAARG